MKKRVLSVLLAIVMVVGMFPVTAGALPAPHTHPVCGKTHTDIGDHAGTCEAVGWTAWSGTTDITYTDGTAYVYLSADVSLSGALVVGANQTLYLCLNDHVLDYNGNSASGAITVRDGGVLYLTDCCTAPTTRYGQWNEANTVYTISTSQPDGGSFDTLTGGVITGGGYSANLSSQTYYGGGVWVYNGTFYMYGGTIAGNTAFGTGGGVHVDDAADGEYGIFYMYDGTITGNRAANGGGIDVFEGTFYMYGGTIAGNTATGSTGGGGVYVSESEFYMSGGSITDNRATANGGGVVLSYSNKSKFNMSGGSITGNSADKNGGGVYAPSSAYITVSGAPKIINNTKGTGDSAPANNLVPESYLRFTVSGTLGTGASIGIFRTAAGRFSAGGANSVGYFSSDNAGYIVEASGDNLKLAEAPHSHDMSVECGNTDPMAFNAWDGTDKDGATNGIQLTAGSWYLTDNVTLTETLIISSGTVNMCLNGHNITNSSAAIEVKSGATLNICDCGSGGTVSATASGSRGIENYGILTVYGGTVSGNTYGICNNYGGNVAVSGGTVSGGTGIENYGTLTVSGGSVKGTHTYGGYGISTYGTFKLSGAPTITGGSNSADVLIHAYQKVITIDGTLTYSTPISVEPYNGYSAFTEGWNDKMPTADHNDYFIPASGKYVFCGVSDELKPAYTVTYDANGAASGSVPVDSSSPYFYSNVVTVLDNTGGLAKEGYEFSGWNTKADGTGTHYAPDSTFTIYSNTTLYAVWKVPHIHEYTYAVNTENAAQIIESCTCGHTGTATISATDATYDGLVHNTATVDYSEGWKGGELTISYANNTNAGTATASITIEDKTASVKFTIEKATPTAEDFIFTAPTDLIYDGTAKPATITVKDCIVGMGEVNVIYFRDAGVWIDNEREPIYPGRYKVGIWIKEGDNYKAVYSDERIWLGSEFEIKYLTTDAKADISGTMGSNGWYTSDVTLTAPEGYQISKTKYNDGFVSKLTFSAEQNETITYYLKDANGDVAEKTATLKIDKTAPSAKYQIGTDGWKQFINTITFGLFCKDYKTVDIEYTDELSGVAEKQYYISREEITNTSRIAWLDYTDTLSLNATGKYFIYMRVVDNAGNEVILNTEGIVIYEDSVQVTESVSATYNAGTDKAVTVKLNGNTVNAIQNGNAVLTADTDYTVSADGTITLKASYLDALNAGEYTFTVSYNPQGVETDKVNMTTTFTVKVEKADGKVSNLNISGKTYDGTAVTAPTFDKPGDGVATIEYKVRGADDSTYTTTAPKDAGNYVVRVTVAESTNYKAASATTYFAIASAELRDVSVQQNGKLTYNGQAQTPTVSTSATTVDGSKVTFTYSTEMEGTYGAMPTFTNAGWAHTVYYRATADNHNTYYGSFHVEIEKATVTEPTIASKPYNGSVQTADITDTELYTVVKNDGGTGVKLNGYYDVVLKLKDSANYKWSTTENAQVTLPFAITRAENEWAVNPSISGWTYGETANEPVGEAKFGADSVEYSGTTNGGAAYSSSVAPTEAGSYKATFTVQETEDYKGLETSVDFTIAKKAVTVTANDASKTYGDSDPALTYTHTELVGSDALDITVSRASGETANTYTITASQEDGANPNYEITFKTGIFTIRKAPLTVTVEDKTATYGDAVPTYTVKYEGFKNGDDKENLGGALAFECGYAQFSDKGEYTIKASGYTSGNYTISYVDGKLTVNAKPITVTIQNATSVYGDTLAELKATDNGIVNGDTNVYSLATTATSTSNVGKYTITVTALDSNYDVIFVNGEYEITKREITITVDAKNTVVNTTLPTYTYKVEGLVGVDTLVTEPTLTCNANIALIGEYDITASGADAGGNYSIKYVPAKLTVLTDNAVDAAAGYTEELKDYDPATVTSEDKAELDEMLSEINTILADETTTDNGKKALEEVKEQVEKLIKEINDAAEATDTENTEKVENVTPENVIPENKTDLEGAKADLEKALEDNGGNYTEDEKKAIEDEIKRIDDALEVIGNVEAVEDLIDKLPENITKNDEDAIKAADDAYNALSDYEKSLVDEEAKKALDDAKAALAELNKPADTDSPQTGDNSNIFLWIALLFISGGAVITLTVVDRKKRMASKR